MTRSYFSATLAVLLVALALACSPSKSSSSGLATIISPETVVLSNAQAALATIHPGSLTFPASGNENLLTLHAGNVLVSGYVNESANIYGFLEIVVSVQQQGDQIVIATTPGALTDVFEQLDWQVTFSGPSTQSDRVEGAREPDLRSGGPSNALFNYNFTGATLADNGAIKVSVTDGNISFAPQFTWHLQIEKPRHVKLFSVAATGVFASTIDLTAVATQTAVVKISVPGGDFYKVTWVGTIDVVPVVVTFGASVNIGGSASATDKITVSGGVTGSTALTVGMQYTDQNNGTWSAIAPPPSVSWNTLEPVYDADISAYMKVTSSLTIAMRLYDVLGPYFSFGPYAKVSLDKYPICNWALTGGLAATVGANAKVGWLRLDAWSKPIFDKSVPYLSGACCNAKNCPHGCCDLYNVCQPGTIDTVCGNVGDACANCLVQPQLEHCENQACVDDDDDNDDDAADDDDDDGDNSGCGSAALLKCDENAAETVDAPCNAACDEGGSDVCQKAICRANCDFEYQNALIACNTEYPCAASILISHCVQGCDTAEVGCLNGISDCNSINGDFEELACLSADATCTSKCTGLDDDDNDDNDAVDDDNDDNDDNDACGADNCPGCCAGSACMAGNTDAACGANGAACASCDTGQRCASNGEGGVCACDWKSCPTGCCDSEDACQPGNAADACGTYGDGCLACPAGQECFLGGWCQCDSTSCPAGCCDAGGDCQPGSAETDCGVGGEECMSCALIQQQCTGNQCLF